MSESEDDTFFYGVLGRVTVQDGDTELRFYPFTFEMNPAVNPVFGVTLTAARFGQADIASRIGAEMEVAAYGDRVEIVDIFDSAAAIVIHAQPVAVRWSPYDMDDLRGHIQTLNKDCESKGAALSDALRTHREGVAIMRELLRRAEIKSAASDTLKASQAAAISVLQRLLGHFEGNQ